MHQFLRLMFDPVAGRMVRTLFLERLRAERELAPPAGAAIERVVSGALVGAQGEWSQALARTRLPMADDPGSPPTCSSSSVPMARAPGSRCGTVAQQDRTPGPLPLAVLSPAGPYGRVVESVGADDATHALVAALAQPPARPGLAHARTGERAAATARPDAGRPGGDRARVAAAEHAGDPAFLDTAACLAGVTPAWSGGPLTWAWAERDALRGRLGTAGERAWARLEPALARDFA